MKTKLSLLLFGLLSMLCVMLTGCSNDVENYIIIPNGNGQEYVEKKGSNFILNVGDSNYGTQSLATRAYSAPLTRSVTLDQISASKETGLTDVIVGTNANQSWYKYSYDKFIDTKFEWSKIVGANEGYVYSKAYLESPYDNEWNSAVSIDNGNLTIKGVKFGDFYSPVPVEFWGRHDLAVTDQKVSTYKEGETENGWTISTVTESTNTVAVSKNIQYANSGIKIKLQLGKERWLAWYDSYQSTNVAVEGTLITEENIDAMPSVKCDTIDGTERYISNLGQRQVGKYFHQSKGNTIAIKQKDGKSWHFIGPNVYDDVNFEIQEIRIESSESCTYGKDYTYAPSDSKANYSYDFSSSHFVSGDSTMLTVMPTLSTSSKVILHCKITKFPESSKNFTWYINKSLDDNTLIPVQSNTEFFIIGKISNIEGKTPSGSPYSTTWKTGIYCPDVITNVNILIDDLCVDGAAVTDPDAPLSDKNIIWNYDWNYGTMDGQWTIGK